MKPPMIRVEEDLCGPGSGGLVYERGPIAGEPCPRHGDACTVWEHVTDVRCPVRGCSGMIRWAEAGYVPGWRICDRCDANFLAIGVALGDKRWGLWALARDLRYAGAVRGAR